ncbi:hypoxanthine-guanine phosphoribosyltransferase [Thiofaba sp. EF100]|jgi:hypoxanthine phosphoribosyltransferase|uniref:hypoxanthine-guanine phosphoribosyltransferase n=1 Tax=Thiofaba sp. EF100 TaxID=3121274 RepID=UPI0032221F81
MQAAELNALRARAECLVDGASMEAAYDRLAESIRSDLADRIPLVLVVMTGGVIAAGKLLPRLDFPLEIDYLHATRYGEATRGGELRWLARPRHSLAGRHVLIIDDIFDEGVTLKAIVEACRIEGAASVRCAVAVDKRHGRKVEGFLPDYVGVEVPDRFLVGEGMDYRGYFRNLNGIHALPDTP